MVMRKISEKINTFLFKQITEYFVKITYTHLYVLGNKIKTVWSYEQFMESQ